MACLPYDMALFIIAANVVAPWLFVVAFYFIAGGAALFMHCITVINLVVIIPAVALERSDFHLR